MWRENYKPTSFFVQKFTEFDSQNFLLCPVPGPSTSTPARPQPLALPQTPASANRSGHWARTPFEDGAYASPSVYGCVPSFF